MAMEVIVLQFKKIQPGCFRDLVPDEVRVLFLRHPEHHENIALDSEVERLKRQGQLLAKAGIAIAGAISSPADRALIAVYATKAGMGIGGYTHTDERLSDLNAEDPDLVKRLKKAAKDTGKEAEVYIFELCKFSKEFSDLMYQRGTWGALTLYDFAARFKGQTILAVSHGGSRMEVTIAGLRHDLEETIQLGGPDVFLERCQMVELIIKLTKGTLVEENYLEPPPTNA